MKALKSFGSYTGQNQNGDYLTRTSAQWGTDTPGQRHFLMYKKNFTQNFDVKCKHRTDAWTYAGGINIHVLFTVRKVQNPQLQVLARKFIFKMGKL